MKDSKYVKINSVLCTFNPLYFIFSKVNGYLAINKSKYLTLLPTSKEGLWSKIGDLIRSITKNSDDYDEKYMKTKLNSDKFLA